MKISIITCTFNRKKKLFKNIKSVFKQNYNNYEHFIIDDGSTDDTEKLIKKINSNKIIYIKILNNSGQPAALFKSQVFKKISGDIVILLDSDDYLLPQAFNQIIKDFKIFSQKNIISINYGWEKIGLKKIKYIKKASSSIFRDDHPRNIKNDGFRDYLSVRRKSYYKTIDRYFRDPKYWYITYYNYCMKNNNYEVYTNKRLFHMTFDNDTVTRGFNITKYAKWSLFTREYVFKKFKNKMDKKYLRYTLFSLVNNYLVNEGCKIKVLKLFYKEIKFFSKEILFFIVSVFNLLIPYFCLLWVKKKIKSKREQR